jgi:hypothetical protein
VGLKSLELVKYNTLLSRTKLEHFIKPYFDVVHYEDLSFYLLMSRIVQPLLVQPDPPRHNHPVNSVAAEMMAHQIGINAVPEADFAGVYVLRRKP